MATDEYLASTSVLEGTVVVRLNGASDWVKTKAIEERKKKKKSELTTKSRASKATKMKKGKKKGKKKMDKIAE